MTEFLQQTVSVANRQAAGRFRDCDGAIKPTTWIF